MDGIVKEKLISIFPMLKEHWEKAMPFIKERNIPSKTIILREGDVSENLYIILNGCLRLYFIKKDGSEITSQFFFENQLVSSIESFIEKKPSRRYLESLEQTAACFISAKDMRKMIDLHEDFRKWYSSYLKNRLVYYTRIHASFILDSPEERYLKLIDEYPHILQRIPHYYIATYLGITPVSLSRIRARIKNKGN